ncbi:hypothetical protein CROQUDRAFT_722185 [Cronartium quercuum f. sp. fusiforme G11]|uniref:CWF21 domain-containing protein n=1 Tax=Cronartium quercuum f. sp. fusiforme G11 TaxID=708437 RepID=A0A9P6NIP3_9BASI|nr:hypothetical protein CROQUDRAFT_722185 [Cronartium quercuum f. sp. fusiforme G11]
MSYNNIGLTTPRGSGTSGHVQRNLSNIQSRDSYSRNSGSRYDEQPIKHRKPDASILEHERKRRIENKCVELQLELEDEGIEEDVIEQRVQELRSKLMSEESAGRERGPLKPHETHELAAMKAKENDKFRAAMGVKASYVEGEAFDKELQQQRKQQLIEEREKRDAERAARLSAQKEAREMYEKRMEASREQVQKEVVARREEAERRRALLDAEHRADRRHFNTGPKPSRLTERMQVDPPFSTRDRRGRRSPDDESPKYDRRHQTRSPSGSPPRTDHYRRSRDSKRDADVYRPSRGRSASASPRRSPSRSLSRSRSRSPPRRRRPSYSPSPRRRREHSRSRSPAPRRRVRSRSTNSSRSRSRSFDSGRQRGGRNKSRHVSDTPPPPPGFRAFNQQQQAESDRRVQADSTRQSPARRPRSRSRSQSDRGGSMDMSDASD